MSDIILELEHIDREEAFRYMGFGNETPDESFLERVNAIEEKLIKTAKPRFIWRLMQLSRNEDGIYNAGSIKLNGISIAEHLKDCSEVVFMATTLSSQTDMLISRANAINMTDALIADALASAGIEQICNKAELLISRELKDKYMTWRFSPGYGDLPIQLQEDFVSMLDAQRKIGLTVTDSSMLIPTKSVTAIIGISDRPLPKKRQGCMICNMHDKCQFRKKGVHCGNV